jgi:putative ABC transport system substrate-binding protein
VRPGAISRRRFVVGAGALGVSATGVGLLAGCGRLPWQAPVPVKVPRIGVGIGSGGERYATALLDGLRELGYVEGQSLAVEWRFAGGSRDRVVEAVAELVALNVDAIVVQGVTAARAAQDATRTIPIVIVMLSDPVANGFVASLARPGSNITGLGSFGSAGGLRGKAFQLLVEAIPSVTRLGVLWETSPSHPIAGSLVQQIQEAGPALRVHVESLAISEPHEVASAVQAAIEARLDAIYTLQTELTIAQRPQILELVAQARLPAMYEIRDWTEAGGLMSYGPSFPAMHRRAAYYVDRILKGTEPADLPVEQPMTFEFVVNLNTAQALGIKFPNEIMLQVTEVIQ